MGGSVELAALVDPAFRCRLILTAVSGSDGCETLRCIAGVSKDMSGNPGICGGISVAAVRDGAPLSSCR